jgi:hypothetical protein
MSEAKQSLGQVVFEIKMKFSIEKSDEAIRIKSRNCLLLKNYFLEISTSALDQ